ncbi:unnamed protein product, partial [Strongylus vulgaris]
MADFAVDLLKLTPAVENMVMSPLSLIAALKSENDVSELLRKLGAAEAVTMSVATKLFLTESMEIRQEYNDSITRDFGVVAEHLDFENKELTIETVNKFVSDSTHKMIPSLLNDDFYRPEMRAFLVNAVYFKGLWATQFSPNATNEDTFHGIKGDREARFGLDYQQKLLQDHDHKQLFMRYFELKECRYSKEEEAEVLVLPYKDNQYKFVIFLPSEGAKFEDFRTSLTGEIL